MKKNYFIFSFILLLNFYHSESQVLNGNFENSKPNGSVNHWGINFSLPVSIDTNTGQTTSDTILFDNYINFSCFSSSDAYSGQKSLEIRNAYNLTLEQVITGGAMIFSDDTFDSPGWNQGVPILPGQQVNTLGFYYKFLPMGNDVAQANITVFDENGDEIGKTSIDISGTNNQFNYIYSYIDYTSYSATRAFMYISFTMAKEGSTPTFGSRLIIDNVVTNFQSLNVAVNPNTEPFRVYPTLVESEINIASFNQTAGEINYKIINTQGRVVKENTVADVSNYIYTMDVGDLSSGIYLLQIESDAEKIIKKFVKK